MQDSQSRQQRGRTQPLELCSLQQLPSLEPDDIIEVDGFWFARWLVFRLDGEHGQSFLTRSWCGWRSIPER